MTAALISQGELGDIKDREVKCSPEEKAWIGKEGIYKIQANDKCVYFIKGRLEYDLETNGIRRRVHEAMELLG